VSEAYAGKNELQFVQKKDANVKKTFSGFATLLQCPQTLRFLVCIKKNYSSFFFVVV